MRGVEFPPMRIVAGRVVDGRIEVEEALPEGADVTVHIQDLPLFELSSEEKAELDERFEAAERGEVVEGDEVIRRLRDGSYAAPPARRLRTR